MLWFLCHRNRSIWWLVLRFGFVTVLRTGNEEETDKDFSVGYKGRF